MKLHRMTFDGEVLARGFWIYVWRVTTERREVLYVGRTGDSSSPHAGSPFSRIGAHLESGPNAKANSLYRRLVAAGIDPRGAKFSMTAAGPLFAECADMKSHTPCRNMTGAVERAVGEWLRKRGYEVLSIDPTRAKVDGELLAAVQALLEPHFPPAPSAGASSGEGASGGVEVAV